MPSYHEVIFKECGREPSVGLWTPQSLADLCREHDLEDPWANYSLQVTGQRFYPRADMDILPALTVNTLR